MDDLDMPREMPDIYGSHTTERVLRVLWRRYWHLSAQVDRLASRQTITEETMATQADLDALAADLGAAVTRIQDEITALQQANPELDLSGLQAAVAQVDALAPVPSDQPPADQPPAA